MPRPITRQRPRDVLASPALTTSPTPSPSLHFEGMSIVTASSGGAPPDPVGDVGLNYYVQMVNSAFAVYDKETGATVMAPTQINQLWIDGGAPGSDQCRKLNDGDPIVLYDQLADRWMLSQFAGVRNPPPSVCIAVSQTSDPTGAYYLYTFVLPDFPDYPKYGVWPTAYFMGSNESTYAGWAFDRVSMLAGASAGAVGIGGFTNFLMPADADGPVAPPSGSPGLFYTFKDNDEHGEEGTGVGDRLEIYDFDIDFSPAGDTSFALTQVIPVAAFNYTVCGFFVLDCIPQRDTDTGLDPIGEWPMHRLQYRNFGTHENLVGNFTVDVSGSNQGGIRWFELRRTPVGAGPWVLHQEGTHAPDTTHRWMGSIAMDGDGNIALGYSASSDSIHPALRYASRLPLDPPGTLQIETSLIEGTGSQLGTYSRWGDYSSLNVDPEDDRTFWYTGEYYQSTGSFDWHTRIGQFKIESPTELLVEANLFLEGPYDSGKMDTSLALSHDVPGTHPFSASPWNYSGTESVIAVGDSVVDWILLSLVRGDPAHPPMSLEAQRAAFLLSTGEVVDTSGTGPVSFSVSPDSSYYLVGSARNHLPVMSSGPLNVVGEIASWDFTSSDSMAYSASGPALANLGGDHYGLFACDIDQDGQITASDFNIWLADTKAVLTGYLASDCDLDAQSTASDFNLWLSNTKAVIQSQVPAF